jgi:hypothetical protein
MNSQEIIQILKLFQVDTLINLLIIYYIYRMMNMGLILLENFIRFVTKYLWRK